MDQTPPAIVQPATGGVGQTEKAMDKIDPMLELEFEQRPGQEYGVVVAFKKLPDHKTLDAMGLRPVLPSEATGHLSRSHIEELAKRMDVLQIRSRPKPTAY